jgi:hypothetical protein
MKEDRREHPGWAIRYKDGTWLASAHGFHRMEDAFYAKTYPTSWDASVDASEALRDGIGDRFYEIVEAWQPLCEQLRHKILVLTKANTIDPDYLYDIVEDLESVLLRLKKGSVHG